MNASKNKTITIHVWRDNWKERKRSCGHKNSMVLNKLNFIV